MNAAPIQTYAAPIEQVSYEPLMTNTAPGQQINCTGPSRTHNAPVAAAKHPHEVGHGYGPVHAHESGHGETELVSYEDCSAWCDDGSDNSHFAIKTATTQKEIWRHKWLN